MYGQVCPCIGKKVLIKNKILCKDHNFCSWVRRTPLLLHYKVSLYQLDVFLALCGSLLGDFSLYYFFRYFLLFKRASYVLLHPFLFPFTEVAFRFPSDNNSCILFLDFFSSVWSAYCTLLCHFIDFVMKYLFQRLWWMCQVGFWFCVMCIVLESLKTGILFLIILTIAFGIMYTQL